jgi:hypothetical protein
MSIRIISPELESEELQYSRSRRAIVREEAEALLHSDDGIWATLDGCSELDELGRSLIEGILELDDLPSQQLVAKLIRRILPASGRLQECLRPVAVRLAGWQYDDKHYVRKVLQRASN